MPEANGSGIFDDARGFIPYLRWPHEGKSGLCDRSDCEHKRGCAGSTVSCITLHRLQPESRGHGTHVAQLLSVAI